MQDEHSHATACRLPRLRAVMPDMMVVPNRHENVAGAVADWAKRRPHGIALRFLAPDRAAEEISFAALDARADGIAEHLLTFPPGSRAALVFKPGIDFVAAFLACLRVGIIAVPLRMPSPRTPRDRISAVLADCGAAVMLTDSGDIAAAHAEHCPVVD